jgi:hypothetical protein
MIATTMPITTIAVQGVSPGLGFGASDRLLAAGGEAGGEEGGEGVLFFTAPVEAAHARL